MFGWEWYCYQIFSSINLWLLLAIIKPKSQISVNNDDRKGTPSIPTRSRRLSSEGQKYAKKDNLLIKLSDDAIKPQPFDAVSILKYGQIQDAKAVTRPFGHFSNGGSITMEASHAKAPQVLLVLPMMA